MSTATIQIASYHNLKVLSPQSLDILHARGEAVREGGYRSISNTSYMSANSLDSEATVLIPDELHSEETLRFLEFNGTTAEKIWREYLERRAKFPNRANVLKSAKRHLDSFSIDPFGENDSEWIEGMNLFGMSSNFQARIMAPDMKTMRLFGTVKTWIFEMIDTRWKFLEGLDDVIKSPPIQILGRKSSHPVLGSFKTRAPPEIPERISSQNKGKGPAIGSFKAPAPLVTAAADEPLKAMDGHTMLFRGSSQPYLDELFIDGGKSVNFRHLRCHLPTDFTQGYPGVYFTKNYQVAWQCAQWSKRVVDGRVIPVEILHVAVPNFLFSSAMELYGDIWRKFVWCNRREEPAPKDLRYLEAFEWLIGPIVPISNDEVKKLTDPAELPIWKLEHNEMPSQFYAAKNETLHSLNDHCVGKVWRTLVDAGGEFEKLAM